MNMTRRDALKGMGALTIGAHLGGPPLAAVTHAAVTQPAPAQAAPAFDLAAIERDRVIKAAAAFMKERSIAFAALNPDNVVEHRRALMRFSVQMPALAAAWKLTGEPGYARFARFHLRAWFITPATRMNVPLIGAEAARGRGLGVLDTIHLVEVARAIETIRHLPILAVEEWNAIETWFAEYLRWLTTDKAGLDARDAPDHSGTCWVMQVAAFAHLTKNETLLTMCRDRYKTALLPGQLGTDGSFPHELQRANSYSGSLFNLEAMAMICQIASTAADNLWKFEIVEPEPPSGRSGGGGDALGRGMRLAMNFMTPYVRDKSKWPYPRDVMNDEHWPMRQQSLLFAGLALDRPEYLELWKTLPADSTVEDVVRNYFIRQPVLWS